jgi:hypothetical protein
VDVSLDGLGALKVDYGADLLDVKATGGDVSGDQDVGAGFELVHYGCTLKLGFVAVDCEGCQEEVLLDELLKLLTGLTLVAEYQHLAFCNQLT